MSPTALAVPSFEQLQGITAGGLEHVQSCHDPTPSRHALARLSAGGLASGQMECFTPHRLRGRSVYQHKLGYLGVNVGKNSIHGASGICRKWLNISIKQGNDLEFTTWDEVNRQPISVCSSFFGCGGCPTDGRCKILLHGLAMVAGWRWCSAPTFTPLAFLSRSFLFMLESTCPRRKRLRGWNTIYLCFWVGLVLIGGCGCWVVSMAVWNSSWQCLSESGFPGTQTTTQQSLAYGLANQYIYISLAIIRSTYLQSFVDVGFFWIPTTYNAYRL